MPECLILNLVLFHSTVHIKEHVRKILSSFYSNFVDLKCLLCYRHLQSAPFDVLFQFSCMENTSTGSSFSIFHRISVSVELCRKNAWLHLAFWSGINRQIYTAGHGKLLKCLRNTQASTDKLAFTPSLSSKAAAKNCFSLLHFIQHSHSALSQLPVWCRLSIWLHKLRCSFLG